jgi:hypothetical protein
MRCRIRRLRVQTLEKPGHHLQSLERQRPDGRLLYRQVLTGLVSDSLTALTFSSFKAIVIDKTIPVAEY